MGNPLYRPVKRWPQQCDWGRISPGDKPTCDQPGRNVWQNGAGGGVILCDPHDAEAERFISSGEKIQPRPAKRGQ